MTRTEVLNHLIDLLKFTETKPLLNEISDLVKKLVATEDDYCLIVAKKLIKQMNYEYITIIKPAIITIIDGLIEVL